MLRPRTYEIAFRKVHPTDCAVGVEQILGGTRNVCVVLPARVWMHKVPLPDDLQFVVTEEEK